MPKKTFRLPIWPASGGLDQSSIPGTAKPEKLEDCDNVLFTVNGSRKKKWGLNTYYRSGYTPTVSQGFRGLTDFWRNVSNVQTHKVVSFVGNKVWADAADGRFTDITGAASLVAGDQVIFDVFEGLQLLFFENAVPYKWNMVGNIAVLGGVPASCSLGRVHKRRVWLAGNKAAPHRLYYSAVDAPEDYTLGSGGGSLDLDSGDSDPVGIVAIFPSFFDDLYVAKRRSLYRIREIYDYDQTTGEFVTTFKVEPVIKGIGCISHNSVIATPNDLIWCSERGIHSLRATDQYGDVDAAFLSFPIHEFYNSNVNFSKAKNMWAVYAPELNSYLLAFTRRGQSHNVDLLGYNLVLGEWFRWQNYDAAALCQFVDSRGKTRILVGQEDLNIGILDQDLVTDLGTSYSMYCTTPIIYPMGRPDVEVDYKNLWLFFKPQDSGNIYVSYQIDDKDSITETVDQRDDTGDIIGTAIIGQGIIGGAGTIKTVRVPLQGAGRGIRFTFSQIPTSTTTGEDCDIYGYIIEGAYAEDSALSTAI